MALPGALSTPNLLFYFPSESIDTLTQRWNDWVDRDATVSTRKDQSEDTPGVLFEMLRTRVLLRPALTPVVSIAEPRISREHSAGNQIICYPFLPWPWPNAALGYFRDDDPDVIWVVPRELTVDDFPAH